MSDLFDVYATQTLLIWGWRGGPRSLVKRGVLTLVIATISCAVTAAIMPGISIDSLAAAAFAVILVALFNALVRPVLLAIVAPWSLIAIAILVVVLQIVAFFFVVQLAPGVHVDGVVTAWLSSIVYTIINTTLVWLLGIAPAGWILGPLVRWMPR